MSVKGFYTKDGKVRPISEKVKNYKSVKPSYPHTKSKLDITGCNPEKDTVAVDVEGQKRSYVLKKYPAPYAVVAPDDPLKKNSQPQSDTPIPKAPTELKEVDGLDYEISQGRHIGNINGDYEVVYMDELKGRTPAPGTVNQILGLESTEDDHYLWFFWKRGKDNLPVISYKNSRYSAIAPLIKQEDERFKAEGLPSFGDGFSNWGYTKISLSEEEVKKLNDNFDEKEARAKAEREQKQTQKSAKYEQMKADATAEAKRTGKSQYIRTVDAYEGEGEEGLVEVVEMVDASGAIFTKESAHY